MREAFCEGWREKATLTYTGEAATDDCTLRTRRRARLEEIMHRRRDRGYSKAIQRMVKIP